MKLSHKLKHKALWFLANRLPACREILPVVSQSLDAPLSLRQRVELKLHLLICQACTRYAKQLSFMREAVRRQEVHPAITMTNETRARLQQALKGMRDSAGMRDEG